MASEKKQQVDEKTNVLIGKIIGVYGIKGWVKVLSYTRPKDNILNYEIWLVGSDAEQIEQNVTDCKRHGKGIIAKLQTVDDREQARLLTGSDIYIRRSQLPELATGEYYWHELMGLSVVDQYQKNLGTITDILETGGNDVFVITGDKRRLIPWVMGIYIKEIDLDSEQVRVDWQGTED